MDPTKTLEAKKITAKTLEDTSWQDTKLIIKICAPILTILHMVAREAATGAYLWAYTSHVREAREHEGLHGTTCYLYSLWGGQPAPPPPTPQASQASPLPPCESNWSISLLRNTRKRKRLMRRNTKKLAFYHHHLISLKTNSRIESMKRRKWHWRSCINWETQEVAIHVVLPWRESGGGH